MTTVGYGDITPTNISEKVYVIYVMGIASGVFGFIVASISKFVSNSNLTGQLIKEKFKAVNKFMKRKKVPRDLQFKVRRFLDYVLKGSKQTKVEDDEIFSWLSEPLKFEINAYLHGIVLDKSKIFSAFDKTILTQLSKILKNVIFAPEDIIFKEGESSNHMYFITTGAIQIYDEATLSGFAMLNYTEFFGEIAFFSNLPRCASARCVDFAELKEIDFDDFYDTILQRFPDNKKVYETIQQKMVDSGDFSDINVSCYICGKMGHFAKKCNKIKFSLDQEKLQKISEKKYETKIILPGQKDCNFERKNRKFKKRVFN